MHAVCYTISISTDVPSTRFVHLYVNSFHLYQLFMIAFCINWLENYDHDAM